MTYYSCHDFYLCVDPEGFEPSTFSMPLRRAPNVAMGRCDFSTAKKGAMLSISVLRLRMCPDNHQSKIVIRKSVDLRGFEPLASSVRLRRAPNCATGPFFRR